MGNRAERRRRTQTELNASAVSTAVAGGDDEAVAELVAQLGLDSPHGSATFFVDD